MNWSWSDIVLGAIASVPRLHECDDAVPYALHCLWCLTMLFKYYDGGTQKWRWNRSQNSTRLILISVNFLLFFLPNSCSTVLELYFSWWNARLCGYAGKISHPKEIKTIEWLMQVNMKWRFEGCPSSCQDLLGRSTGWWNVDFTEYVGQPAKVHTIFMSTWPVILIIKQNSSPGWLGLEFEDKYDKILILTANDAGPQLVK